VTVEWIIRDTADSDLEEILKMENALFAVPWSRKAFEAEISRFGGIRLTAEAESGPIGYAVAWCVAGEVHIANLAVHPAWQKKGVGQSLLRELLARCPESEWAGLEVRRSNAAAIALYRKLGFRETGVRKNYYAEEREDAILMEKTLRGGHGVV
jgi:[ribosomal protein S18]-alanine N-acetyltransferase